MKLSKLIFVCTLTLSSALLMGEPAQPQDQPHEEGAPTVGTGGTDRATTQPAQSTGNIIDACNVGRAGTGSAIGGGSSGSLGGGTNSFTNAPSAFQTKCMSCHATNGKSLTPDKAGLIAQRISNGSMPPAGAPTLSESEKSELTNFFQGL